MQFVTRLWKRHVRKRPDKYQAYVSLPTSDDDPSFGEVHDCIERLEHVFEGRLDVYARTRRLAVVSDPVSADRFDADAFEAALESLEDCYEARSLARVEKWRPSDDRLVKSHVVVPVKPLFPPDRTVDEPRIESVVE
ncbi:hypothetical protein JMJ58_04420 [Haloterrigena salifodinae]|uniref:Uncharacterized protein n=1 Tax=Haloterrigena salifodinae TaxID=2675099 RepID=A0A8T8E319_9EURY|nr:hypothetical protein [Haloterrigena salifodinae]QRV16148.1 hypothetical protein JMJ58_04420 [Haloterrigena salifodinae]